MKLIFCVYWVFACYKECLLATDDTFSKITFKNTNFNQNANSIKMRFWCNLTPYCCFVLVSNMKICHNFKNHFVKKKVKTQRQNTTSNNNIKQQHHSLTTKTMILIRNHKYNWKQYIHSANIIKDLKFIKPNRIR